MATQTQDLQKEIKKTTTDAVTLAKSTVDRVQQDVNETVGEVRDSVQNVFLAGLGALALAEEEGSKLFKDLVQKGGAVELPSLGADRLKAVRDDITGRADKAAATVKGRVDTAKTSAEDTADKAEDRLQETVATVMKRLGVPTRTEVAELSASVERLTAHIDRLKTEKAAATVATKKAPAKAAAKPAAKAAKAKPAATTVQAEPVMESVGGGWYEVKVGDIVVEKVRGKDVAEAALARAREAHA